MCTNILANARYKIFKFLMLYATVVIKKKKRYEKHVKVQAVLFLVGLKYFLTTRIVVLELVKDQCIGVHVYIVIHRYNKQKVFCLRLEFS